MVLFIDISNDSMHCQALKYCFGNMNYFDPKLCGNIMGMHVCSGKEM